MTKKCTDDKRAASTEIRLADVGRPTRATLVRLDDQVKAEGAKKITVLRNADGNIESFSWPYAAYVESLRRVPRKFGLRWDGLERVWRVPELSREVGEKVRAYIAKQIKGWWMEDAGNPNANPTGKGRFATTTISPTCAVCLTTLPLPLVADLEISKDLLVALVEFKKVKLCLISGKVAEVNRLARQFELGAAANDPVLAKALKSFSTASPVVVTVKGWAIEVVCDLLNPLHYQLQRDCCKELGGRFEASPNGDSWDGTLRLTMRHWPRVEGIIESAGIHRTGDDPNIREADLIANFKKIKGWHEPAASGNMLYDYQKDGVRFALSRGGRALIGDEMGLGKTPQAIAIADALSATRVAVVCPASARYVWDTEIRKWLGDQPIQHITNCRDEIDPSARWHIMTYDILFARTQVWTIEGEEDEAAIRAVVPDIMAYEDGLGRQSRSGKACPKKKIRIFEWHEQAPKFADARRTAKWQRMMETLKKDLPNEVLAASPLLLVVDEAHRAKNPGAKRTQAIQRIAADPRNSVVLLTGTPLRNHESEAVALLQLLHPEAKRQLSRQRGYTIDDIKDYLRDCMIRRRKSEVLRELPDKTRQRVDVVDLSAKHLRSYAKHIESALDNYQRAIDDGGSEQEAQQLMRPSVELARTQLVLSKVASGAVRDITEEVVNQKGCCVVFCAHHAAIDMLRDQMLASGFRAGVIDGRVKGVERAQVVRDFQAGDLDVLVAGINSGGEAITLTRADTVIFVELDWVPAAILQAEDRVHRVGQVSKVHIIQLVAKFAVTEIADATTCEPLIGPGNRESWGFDDVEIMQSGEGESALFNLDKEMIRVLGEKLQRIGQVLDEDATNVVSEKGMSKEILKTLVKRNDERRRSPRQGASVGVSVQSSAHAQQRQVRRRQCQRKKMTKDASMPSASESIDRVKLEYCAKSGEQRAGEVSSSPCHMPNAVANAPTTYDVVLPLSDGARKVIDIVMTRYHQPDAARAINMILENVGQWQLTNLLSWNTAQPKGIGE